MQHRILPFTIIAAGASIGALKLGVTDTAVQVPTFVAPAGVYMPCPLVVHGV